MKPASKTFQATLERIASPLKWVMARIPFDSGKLWCKRGQIRVKGEINGFVFRSTLFPDGAGGHRLLVTKAMQRGAKAAPGMAVRFRLEPDTEVRVVAVPAELTRALSEDRSLRRWFDALSPSIHNEIYRGVSQLKSPAARLRRARQMAEILLSVKEAERELPPALQIALMQKPLARAGWQMMSPAHRRRHLLGIFYYRTVDARARRIAVAVEDAVQLANRKANRK
ncbi:MAG TPA: YdeI/OmpD-associated family protein [Verrucomicrobiae bacterium]|jgi:uncharacterized protein YdeI (YjbR/CyaY-like superfamily)|nr:YdeI/OmpD-associated family protein [Verrucomicrobiae bacterium]